MKSYVSTAAGCRSTARRARAREPLLSCPWRPARSIWSIILHRILCVEDDQETASLVSEALAERGYSVDVARDGESGLARILETRPDLVVCDIRMPVMGGFELLERLGAAGPSFA